MPRCSRVKTNTSIFHIMIRSISEIDLFKERSDKEAYIIKMKEYQKLYGFKIYAYCLMDNHAHFIINANGADISKVMHGINFSYAQMFNNKYKRHGHLFQDRFKSKIVYDERYLIALSAYIHNNPKDIIKYEGCVEKYEFSSLSAYLNTGKDKYNMLDKEYVRHIVNFSEKLSQKSYQKMVDTINDIKLKEEAEFNVEKTNYLSEKSILVKDIKIEEVLKYVSHNIGVDSIKLHLKYVRKVTEARALAIVIMKGICDFNCSDICKAFGNITQSRVSKLSNIGIRLIDEKPKYKSIISSFIMEYSNVN
ncbi:MAG: transposase [Clostridiaceae bacterium]|nr:transposase [Clostridiaceae bacterium]